MVSNISKKGLYNLDSVWFNKVQKLFHFVHACIQQSATVISKEKTEFLINWQFQIKLSSVLYTQAWKWNDFSNCSGLNPGKLTHFYANFDEESWCICCDITRGNMLIYWVCNDLCIQVVLGYSLYKYIHIYSFVV